MTCFCIQQKCFVAPFIQKRHLNVIDNCVKEFFYMFMFCFYHGNAIFVWLSSKGAIISPKDITHSCQFHVSYIDVSSVLFVNDFTFYNEE